jgi:hypothetical protein
MSRLSIVGATYCRGDGPVTRVSSWNPDLRRGAPRRPGHGGGAMHVGNGGLGGAQAKRRLRGIDEASALHCAQRWAYYNPASGKYMGDDGEWRPCRSQPAVRDRQLW